MFKTTTNPQIDLFKNIYALLPSNKSEKLRDPNSFHQVFRREVILQIHESPFKVLYCKDNGRPNASIRMLIGMMILKEGNGWSDEQLFDSCRYDLRVMLSLGLMNIDEDIPAASSYYLLRKRLVEHNEKTGEDLLEGAFKSVTLQQMEAHGVSGKKIRMDSKLINSNIARSVRVELIAKVLESSVKDKDLTDLKSSLSTGQSDLLAQLLNEGASKLVYQMDAKQRKVSIEQFGIIISKVKAAGLSNTQLDRLYAEQYDVVEEQGARAKEEKEGSQIDTKAQEQQELVKPKDSKAISSGSMQSPHDTEATYRSKGKGQSRQEVQGYHSNVTETCNGPQELDLVLDVQTTDANINENEFLEPAVEAADDLNQKAHDEAVEEVITDGGYDSIENRKLMEEDHQDKTWHLAKTKGANRRYEMTRNDKGELEVKDRKTSKKCQVHYNEKTGKYRIDSCDGTKRYFTREEIDNYLTYVQLDNQNMNPEIYALRANVESTIHQMFHRLKKRNKVVYRTRYKCHIYALSRAFWVNCVRIHGKVVENPAILVKKPAIFFTMIELFFTERLKQQKSKLVTRYYYCFRLFMRSLPISHYT